MGARGAGFTVRAQYPQSRLSYFLVFDGLLQYHSALLGSSHLVKIDHQDRFRPKAPTTTISDVRFRVSPLRMWPTSTTERLRTV